MLTLRITHGPDGGISVSEVLGKHTYAHHWREYSRPEVARYFHLLSPDFTTAKFRLTRTYRLSDAPWKRTTQRLLDICPLLRPNIHAEIELTNKRVGIVATPRWQSTQLHNRSSAATRRSSRGPR